MPEVAEQLELFTKEQPPTGRNFTLPTKDGVCPHCGYCPTCGRPFWSPPVWPPLPQVFYTC